MSSSPNGYTSSLQLCTTKRKEQKSMQQAEQTLYETDNTQLRNNYYLVTYLALFAIITFVIFHNQPPLLVP